MNVIVGIGVEVSPHGIRAVAIDTDGDVVGEARVAGVDRTDELATALGQVVGRLGGHETPVAVAWEDGRRRPDPVVLRHGRPAEVAAHLQRWGAAGVDRIAVAVDEHGDRWGVALGPGHRVGVMIERAAGRAGLTLVGTEPVATARVRRPGAEVVTIMATVASGALAPSTTWPVTTPTAAPAPSVWVIERRPDDPAAAVPARWARLRRARRSIGRRRRPD